MRIRTNIFIWLFFATVVPLTALTLGATYYNQYSYQREVQRKLIGNLDNIALTIERQLHSNRNLALGLARSAAVQAYLPVLRGIQKNEPPANAAKLRQQVYRYFEGFQTIISDRFILRMLDADGNTVAMVNNNRRGKAIYESLSGIKYVEQENTDSEFVQTLSQLAAEEVHSLTLPQNRVRSEFRNLFLLQDMVVPFYAGKTFIGALALSMAGEDIDRLLDRATRLYANKLFVFVLNNDDAERNGLLLYDEPGKLHLAESRADLNKLNAPYAQALMEKANESSEGILDVSDDHQIYFTVMSPYPNQFVSWVIASDIDKRILLEPFSTIRYGILFFAAIALIVSLLLADFGSRRIARPLCYLYEHIKAFADGEHQRRVSVDQPISEVRALATAFNYLADTLQTTEKERDSAQQMVLQSNKLASIGQMAAGIGHEINNPLNNILSYTKLIQRHLEKQRQLADDTSAQQLLADLGSLREETLRASDIVKGILNFARQVPPSYSRFAVPAWLEQTLALVQQTARSRDVTLELQTDYDGEVDGDRGQLQQALVNLLLNAIQASPQHGRVAIHADQLDGQLRIEVRDQGAGIAEADLPNIFDPFFTTKSEGEGSGLGLSISLGIIERHHGKLVIINHPDKGVSASITLPLHACEADTL